MTIEPLPVGRTPATAQALCLLALAPLPLMATMILAPILPQLVAEFRGQPGAAWLAPLILTLPGLCMVLFSPLIGYLGDRFGRRRLLMASLTLYGFSGMVPMVLHNLHAILATRILVGVSEGGVLTLSTALIGDYFKGVERDKWLGYQATTFAVAATVLIFIGGALGVFGWRAPFGLYGLSFVGLAATWWLTWEPLSDDGHEQPGAGLPRPRAAFPWAHMRPVLATALLGGVILYVVQLQGGMALAAAGLTSPAAIGASISIASIGVLLGTLMFRVAAGRRPALLSMVAFLIMAAGLEGMALVTDYRFMTASLFLGMIGCGLMLPTLIAWTVRGLGYSVRARGVGSTQGTLAACQGISTLIMSSLLSLTGSIAASLTIFAVASLGGAAIALGVLFTGRDQANRPAG